MPNVQNNVNLQQNDNHNTVETIDSHATDHVNEASIQDNCQPTGLFCLEQEV